MQKRVLFTNLLTIRSSSQYRASHHELKNIGNAASPPGPAPWICSVVIHPLPLSFTKPVPIAQAFVLGTYSAHPGPAEWNVSVSHVVGGCGWVRTRTA
jgi:hypothetical protein